MERIITYQIQKEDGGLRAEQYLRRKGYSYQNLTQLKKMPESLLINDTIQDNITLPSMRDMGFVLKQKDLKAFAKKYADIMSTKMVGVDQYVSALSGGNKQKVVLARWLGKQSNILLLDSPTRGIDIGVKADIYQLLAEMRNQGKAILIISEEIMELIGMCDRILVMKDGKINGQLFRSPDLTEQDIIAKMI